jgi:hypothetical protein
MPFTGYAEKALLDWCLLGASAPTQPAACFISWATASPTSQSAFDGPFSPRMTVTFAGANSPQGSVTNLNAVTGTATAAGTAVGWNIWDANAAGNRLAYGTFTANVGCKSADNPAFGAGGLIITLS